MTKQSILGIGAGLAAVALPLWLASGGQETPRPAGGARAGRGEGGGRDEERVEGAGPALSRFDGATLPATARFEDATRERQSPTLVARPDGGAWLVALEYEIAQGDRIVVRELAPDGTLARPDAPLAQWPPAGAPPIAAVRPVAAQDGEGRLVVAWTELGDGVAQLRAARLEGGTFAPAFALTRGPLPSRNVELVRAADGTLFAAFEQWVARAPDRGSFDVVVAPLEESGLGPSVAIGDGLGSDLDPVAVASGAGLAIAWSRYGGRDYDIVLRRFDPASGVLSPLVSISADSASDDLHPALAAGADGSLWLAWDRLEDEARGRSSPPEFDAERGFPKRAPASASVRIAQWDGQQVRLPVTRAADGNAVGFGGVAGVPLVSLSGALPRLVALPDGRLALLLRFLARQGPGGKAYGDPLLICAVDGGGVAAPRMVEGSAGHSEEASGALLRDGALLVAWQQDHRLEVETGTLSRPLPQEQFQKMAQRAVVVTGSLGPSALGVLRVASEGLRSGPVTEPIAAAAAVQPREERLDPPHAHAAGAALDDPYVNGADHFTVAGDGAEYRVFWGDLHRHSRVSRCSRGFEPGPDDRYAFGRDTALLDFMALTDHSCHVDPLGWWQLEKAGVLAAEPDFAVLCGFEWSTGFFGHQNILLRGSLRPFLSNSWPNTGTLPGLYAQLKPEWALAIPHHTADVARRTDFAQCDPKLVRLVEIYQAQRGSYEFDGCVRQSHLAHAPGCFATDALARGLKVGFVASTDHGEGSAYACVLAEKLERGALFDALRARRTYGATAKGLFLELRVDGALMGSEIEARGAPRVAVKARAAAELCELIVFRDGAPWQVVGRDATAAPDPARDAARATQLTVQFELLPPKAARALDWRVQLSAPTESGVTMKPWFELPGYARDDLGPDRPQWRVKEGVATWLWKKSYANFWEPSHSRLRLDGPRGAKVRIEAKAVGEGAASGGEGGATLLREVTLAELLAGGAAGDVAGDSPLGAWRLSARESFDAALDLKRSLGTRELVQEWRDEELARGDHWYYARLVTVDGEIAWSSPLFVARK
ncbi:MAG: hypothetical protein JNL90_18905 [Planctomycetes bacterium]|nr:hypothetical protein [Planctomycetota bacterium]